MRRVVITGCGRTGTQHTSQLLGLAGLRSQHEFIYNHKLDPLNPDLAEIEKSWEHEHFEVSWMAAPFLKHLPADTVVFHQLRDPLKSHRCWAQHRMLRDDYNPAGQFACKVFPECGVGDAFDVSVLYHVLWNRLVMNNSWRFKTFRTFRVEDLNLNTLLILLDAAEVELNTAGLARCEFAVKNASRTAGTCGGNHPDGDYNWGDVCKAPWGDELMGMAKKWGYCDG